MAIALVQSQRSQTNGSSTTATFDSATTSGNLLVAIAYTNGTVSALNVSGWTALELAYSGTSQAIGIYYKIADGTETTVTSNGNTICRLHIAEFSGVDNPAATDGNNSNTASGVQSINTNDVTTTNANDLIITAAANSTGSSGTRSWNNSFNTLRDDATSPRLLSGYRIVSSTGTYNSTATLHTANSNSGALIQTFKASGATTTKTIDGKARITATTPSTIDGKGRVTATTTQTVDGKGRIVNTHTQTVDGKARITKSVAQTLDGKARITASTIKTIDGVAKIGLKVENLVDDFNDNTFDTDKWERTNSTQIVEQNSRIEITTDIDGNYVSLDSHDTSYDLTGSSVFIQVVNAGNQSIESLEVYPINLALDADNVLTIYIIANEIQAVKKVAGVNSDVGSAVSYNSATHKFFRIRESSGTVYFDWSTDATSWTNFASTANPFNLTNLQFEVSVGTWQEESTTTTAIFDNVNVVPDLGDTNDQTITGKARITATASQTVQGKGRIQKTVGQTIEGKASMISATQQNITGVARIVGDTTDVEYQVDSSNNDVRNISGNGTFNSTVTTQHLGKLSTTDYWNGWLFEGVDIPQGAIIDTANLNLFSAQTTAGSQAKIILYGVAEDNATAFANNTGNKPEGKARTTASSTKDFTNSLWNATAGFDIEQIDVSSIVQEIVNRTGWASGNNLGLVAHDNGSANNNYIGFSTYDRDPVRGSKLEITYHTAGGTQQTITGKAKITNTTLKTITGKAAIAGEEGTWQSLIMGWIYPAQNDAANDYKDGRKIHFLKPEYYTLSRVGHKGSLYRVDLDTSGEANTYSPENVAEIKAYSDYQFTTVSSTREDMQTFLGNTSARNAGITTLVDFCLDSGFTGIELDWEGYGDWTLANYNAFKLFCTDLGNALHGVGKKLMVDLPPIGNTTMQGYYLLKYEDFNDLPIDYLVVMAYDYQWDYGGGTSVQPISWMQDICDWAKNKITDWENKLVIGMPAYGYHATVEGYNVVIDTKLQSSQRAGYATATRNADYEMYWIQGSTANFYQDTVGLNAKRTAIEVKGIKFISVWHLGDNDWFTGEEPELGEVITSRIVEGKARIAKNATQIIDGKASIAKTVNAQIAGLARMVKGTNQTVTGKARIALVTQKAITGLARLITAEFNVGSQTITGKANIKANTLKTITGKASVKNAVTKTINGKARIVEPQTTEFKIVNNIILDPVREIGIGEIYDALAGLTYHPFKVDDGGLGYFQLGDRITLKDRNNEEFEGLVFDMEIVVNTGISEKLGADIPERTSSPYDRAGIIGQQIRNTEIKVDKQNGVIELINQNIDENYYTKDETQAQITLTTQEIISSVQSVTSMAQSALDLSNTTADQMTVVQSDMTELIQTSEDLTLKVESAGGVNLIKNSVGLKGDIREWQEFDQDGELLDARNNAIIDQGNDIAANTESGSALIITNQFITQPFSTIVGKSYTLYLRFNKVGDLDATITGAGVIPVTIPNYSDGNYAIFKYSFTATDAITTLRFENGDGESATLSDIMVKLGDASGWDQAPNEVYGKNFSFDKDGFTVSSLTDAFKAVLNNRSLAVYDTSGGVDKIMMNVDINASKLTRLVAQDEFVVRRYENTASSMRMIPVADGVYLVIND